MSKSNDPENEELMMTLELEDGSEEDCIVLSIFPAGDEQYIALLPARDADKEDADIYLYGYSEDAEGNPQLRDIEDDDEFDLVCEAFDDSADREDYTELTPDGARMN